MNQHSGAKAQQPVRLAKAKDGSLLVPSVFKDPQGKPRFVMPVPPAALNDMAIRFMVERETRYGGFEYPTRAFIDAHLQPGDLFIDVGAHWGIIALSAATRHPGAVAVIALEAHPANSGNLMRLVAANRLEDAIEVVAAAGGDAPGTAPLVTNTSMGHSLHGLGLQGLKQGALKLTVPLVTLDQLLDERPELSGRRVMIKIDVEGFEPQVLAGARRLLESGQVAAIIWEKGRAFDEEPGRSALTAMVHALDELGYSHHVLASHDLGGPLLPYVPQGGSCNVFSLAAGLEPRPAYSRPPGPVPPIAPSNRGDGDPEARARLTEALIAVGGSDGTRWSDPDELKAGAEDRAALAGQHVRAGERLLDLGAGLMRLSRAIPQDCSYTPTDLVPFTGNTQVLDLNRGDFPEGAFDVVASLELLEYIHDLPRVLAHCAASADRLLCTYRCRADEPVEARRRAGWVNDLSEAALRALLEAAGWTVESREAGADTTLFVCRKAG